MSRPRKPHPPLRICLLIALAACTFPTTPRAKAALSDCIDATCRITRSDGACGSGCVFRQTADKLLVLTNAHVVGNHAAVRCEFWRDGHLSKPLPGQVVVRVHNDQCDAAVVAVDAGHFGDTPPPAVPLAPKEHVVRPGETITSVGCARGGWSTGFEGHALGYRGLDLHFQPVPADGRSGSALFDAEGTHVVGLVRARTADGQQGIACSLQALHKYLGPAIQAAATTTGCPGGLCRPFRFGGQPYYGPQQPTPTWPTLPQPAPSPQVDLSETNQRLDKIAELLTDVRSRLDPNAGQAPSPEKPAAPTSEVQQTQQAVAEVTQETTVLKEKLAGLGDVVGQLVGDVDTIPERIEQRLAKVKAELGEDAGVGDIAKAYVKDFAVEKLSEGTAGWTIGKVLGGALGLSGPLALAVAAGAWFVSRRIGHRIETGEPLLVERLVSAIGGRLDDLSDRVAGQSSQATSRGKSAK